MTRLTLKVRKEVPEAKIPTKAYENDFGLDLYSSEEVCIAARSQASVSTGLSMAIPKGWGGLIKERSGHAKKGVFISGGVIDCQFLGQVIVLINNNTDNYLTVKKGEKFAQMLLLPVPIVDIVEVDELEPTERGIKGFGSSDIKS